jgi:cytochrome c oxidase subunit 3
MSKKNHPYHIVDPGPWPIATSFTLLFVALSAIALMKEVPHSIWAVIIANTLLLYCMAGWWRDVITEGLQMHHTAKVRQSIKIGVILFIVSEVMFFAAFFASIFKNKLLPAKGLDGVWAQVITNWVPQSFSEFDPLNIPLTNTLILLLSSTTLSWAQHALAEQNKADLLRGLKYTVVLGFAFTMLQAFEYVHAPFRMSEGVFTSNFYLATGFHGVHVIIGTIFLAVCYVRSALGHFDGNKGRLGFEFAVWYWHFVDVVWLLLFVFLYLWH